LFFIHDFAHAMTTLQQIRDDVTVLRNSHNSTGLESQDISNDLFRTAPEILKTKGNI